MSSHANGFCSNYLHRCSGSYCASASSSLHSRQYMLTVLLTLSIPHVQYAFLCVQYVNIVFNTYAPHDLVHTPHSVPPISCTVHRLVPAPHSVPTSCTVHRLVHTPHSVPTSCTVHRLVHTPHSLPTSCTLHRLVHTPHSVPTSCRD